MALFTLWLPLMVTIELLVTRVVYVWRGGTSGCACARASAAAESDAVMHAVCRCLSLVDRLVERVQVSRQ